MQKWVTFAETKEKALEKVKSSFVRPFWFDSVDEWIVIQNDGDILSEASEYMSEDRIESIRQYSYSMAAVAG